MVDLRFFAVTDEGVRPLPIPQNAHTFTDLLDGLPVGVYSALRTFAHNQFLFLDAHLDRTEQSMRLMGWDKQLNRQQLCAALDEVVDGAPTADSRVRFDMLAQSAPQRLGTESRLLIATMPLVPPPSEYYENGVTTAFAAELTRPNPLAKTAEYSQRRAEFLQGQDTAVYEYLLLDEVGHILEGSGTNFWGVRDGVLYTAGEGILEGITRKIILQLAPQVGIPVRLQAVHHDEVAALDEAALSGSSRAFLPVVRIEGQVVGDGRPGPISKKLLKAYNSFVAANIKRAEV
ncbi:MAG: aminotransferase class IV [Ardenticatenaceae bacterium]|nr:aminotransferase class IV family protein [Anaerolineales bacterium]MCB8923612.1 aminotransferase class IV [Ardenticatenaceae bacterium]